MAYFVNSPFEPQEDGAVGTDIFVDLGGLVQRRELLLARLLSGLREWKTVEMEDAIQCRDNPLRRHQENNPIRRDRAYVGLLEHTLQFIDPKQCSDKTYNASIGHIFRLAEEVSKLFFLSPITFEKALFQQDSVSGDSDDVGGLNLYDVCPQAGKRTITWDEISKRYYNEKFLDK
jgi:hypothetical protein